MQSLSAQAPEGEGPPIHIYYVHAMETFANPDEWIARDSVLGTTVSHALTRSADSAPPDFIYEDRQLLRNVRDSPASVSTIRLLWEAGSQHLFERDTLDGADYDALVITISPGRVARANYLGYMNQWQNSVKFTHNDAMPHLRVGWLRYIHYCIMMWSTAPRPLEE